VFIPGFTAERHPDTVQELVRRGHEIGHHGYLHERPDTLTDEEEEQILVRGIEVLRGITGAAPHGYRSPSWELKPSSPALLKRYQFAYDSSLMGNDIPYLVEAGEGVLLELPVQWLLDDWPHFAFQSAAGSGRTVAEPSRVLEMWSWEFEGMYRENGCYVLTMHPHIIGRASRIMLLERLIRFINGFPGVWWATCGQIADYCLSHEVCTIQPYLDLG
jgi:peptidoglycan/xylan/chitin deacetylase (PgdA/CDA1 family)